MAKKKLNIDIIPFFIFFIVLASLLGIFYIGILRDKAGKGLEHGKEILFSTLDSIAMQGENLVGHKQILSIIKSINRNDKVKGGLLRYGYYPILEDYLAKCALNSDSALSPPLILAKHLLESKTFEQQPKYKHPIFVELEQAIFTGDKEKASTYLVNLYAKQNRLIARNKHLKQQLSIAIPLLGLAIFFVFFYGIGAVKKRR